MYSIDLTGKNALVFGVANQRSIAWAIAKTLHEAGARVALAYQNERLMEPGQALAAEPEPCLPRTPPRAPLNYPAPGPAPPRPRPAAPAPPG